MLPLEIDPSTGQVWGLMNSCPTQAPSTACLYAMRVAVTDLESAAMTEVDFDIEVLALGDILFDDDIDDFDCTEGPIEDPVISLAVGPYKQELPPDLYQRIKDSLVDKVGRDEHDINAEIVKRLAK